MFFYKLPNTILNIIAPIECLGCHGYGYWFCSNCQKNLQTQSIVINDYDEKIKRVICAFEYKDPIVQKLLHIGKYDGISETIKILAVFLTNNLQTILPVNKNYIFIPVPLHPCRERERGFNQSQIIADVLSTSFSCVTTTGQRVINTPHQVGLNGQQRQKNMINVFTFNPTKIPSDTIAIIVDDVITTGATIKSLAHVIAPYFKTVYAVAIAKE